MSGQSSPLEPLVMIPGLMCDAGVFLPQILALSSTKIASDIEELIAGKG